MAENGKGYNGKYTAAQFIAAIPGSGGIISAIAQRLECDWHTAKKYITRMPTVQRAYKDECEKVTDFAETEIIKAIQAGDIQTAKWYMTMKGRERGYAPTQRRELTGEAGGPIKTKDVDGITDEERIARIAAVLDGARERRTEQAGED